MLVFIKFAKFTQNFSLVFSNCYVLQAKKALSEKSLENFSVCFVNWSFPWVISNADDKIKPILQSAILIIYVYTIRTKAEGNSR